MHLLNLSILEFGSLLGTTLAVVTALYLLDRMHKRRLVSTLRFWNEIRQNAQVHNRARVQQPWSLLLQVLALTLLILAAAGLEWGAKERTHSHVLIIDASSAGVQSLVEEKRLANEYLDRLSPSDSVMLIEASGLVAPSTGFTTDRDETRRALGAIRPTETALALDRTLKAAQQARNFTPGEPGEIVYIGPGRVSEASGAYLSGLRALYVNAGPEHAHIVGAVARPGASPGSWSASITLKNDAAVVESIQLRTSFGATDFAPRNLTLLPGASSRADYEFNVTAEGKLRARLDGGGPAVELPLPRNGPVEVIAYTNRPQQLHPLLASDPRLRVRFEGVSSYQPDADGADIVVLDQFVPERKPRRPSLWLDAPGAKQLSAVEVESWTSQAQLGLGLESRDVRLQKARLLNPDPGDITIASIAEGPVAIARVSEHAVVLGFDPLADGPRLAVASPILIANAVRWLAPDAFSPTEALCREVGAAVVELPPDVRERTIHVATSSGAPVPFVRHEDRVELYLDHPSEVQVQAGVWQKNISMTLPQYAAREWRPAGAIAIGLPVRRPQTILQTELWRPLAILAGLLIAFDWVLFGIPAGRIRSALGVATACGLIAALFAPIIRLPGARTATVALVDTSPGVAPGELTRAAQMLTRLMSLRGRNLLAVVPFSEMTQPASRLELISHRRQSQADLEGALSSALAAAPDGYRARVLLFSDGDARYGSLARAVAQLERVHVPVDSEPLEKRGARELAISSLILPRSGFSGELLPVVVNLEAQQSGPATLRMDADGKMLGQQSLALKPGRNVIRSEARVNASGAIAISAIVESPAGRSYLDDVVQLSRPRLLYYSQDLPGTEENLLAVIKSAGFEVNMDEHALDGDLSANQVVLLNNVDLNVLSPSQKTALSEFVERGGGLLLVGGEHQVYKEDKQLDALDRVLPAKLAPPRNPEGICVAIIVDKSSSMEGRKIDLARLSAIGVVEHLTPRDSIGVLMFDNSYEWAVPMRKAVNKEAIKTLISGIVPDGGTQIAPALAEAYRRVLHNESAYKHIVLLTDGISEEGDSFELASEALAHHVTISTVGLGQDVNRSYLERIALLSGGRSYFLNAPQGLQQILLKDVQDYTGSTTVEKPLAAIVKTKSEVLNGVDMEHAPPLKGYARYQAKPQADTLLTIDREKQDPLFVRWQYGLGRVAIFTSDAKSRWAEAWMKWPGYDKFWTNVLRDLATRNNQTEASAEFDTLNDVLRVRYQLPSGAKAEGTPDLFVLGPQGFSNTLKLSETSPGVYEGHVQVGKREGLFRVRPLVNSWLFPEIGAVRQSPGATDVGTDEQLLRSIAAETGGRYQPPLDRVFEGGAPAQMVVVPLWPGLLLCALLLDICELLVRKRGNLRRLLHLRRSA